MNSNRNITRSAQQPLLLPKEHKQSSAENKRKAEPPSTHSTRRGPTLAERRADNDEWARVLTNTAEGALNVTSVALALELTPYTAVAATGALAKLGVVGAVLGFGLVPGVAIGVAAVAGAGILATRIVRAGIRKQEKAEQAAAGAAPC